MLVFLANTCSIDQAIVAVLCMVLGFSPNIRVCESEFPPIFLLSSHKALPHSYDIQYEEPISSPGSKGKLQNRHIFLTKL